MQLHLTLLLALSTPALSHNVSKPTQDYASDYSIGTNKDLWAWRVRRDEARDVSLACDLFLSRGADAFRGVRKGECVAAMGGFVAATRKGKAEAQWRAELEDLVVGLEGRPRGGR